MAENGNNGKLEPKKEEPQIIEMRIVAEPGQPLKVYFPFLVDKVATYGFLKMGEKVLDAHYANLEKSQIIPAKHGIIDFIRRK